MPAGPFPPLGNGAQMPEQQIPPQPQLIQPQVMPQQQLVQSQVMPQQPLFQQPGMYPPFVHVSPHIAYPIPMQPQNPVAGYHTFPQSIPQQQAQMVCSFRALHAPQLKIPQCVAQQLGVERLS